MSLISLSTWSIFLAGWVKGVILVILLLLALFYQSTPSCLKVRGGWVGARVYGVGARVYGSLVILVSAQVPLVLTLGLWTSGLGLTIMTAMIMITMTVLILIILSLGTSTSHWATVEYFLLVFSTFKGCPKWSYGTCLPSFQTFEFINNLLLEHVGLPHVLYLAVHLVNFFGWMGQEGHSEPLLLIALFY